jgi:hypothetical protein
MDNKQFTVSGALKRRGVASWLEAGVLASLGLLKRKGRSSRVTAPFLHVSLIVPLSIYAFLAAAHNTPPQDSVAECR